jgi:hypothetical protein
MKITNVIEMPDKINNYFKDGIKFKIVDYSLGYSTDTNDQNSQVRKTQNHCLLVVGESLNTIVPKCPDNDELGCHEYEVSDPTRNDGDYSNVVMPISVNIVFNDEEPMVFDNEQAFLDWKAKQ